jgi:S1-C subfamily serine protease
MQSRVHSNSRAIAAPAGACPAALQRHRRPGLAARAAAAGLCAALAWALPALALGNAGGAAQPAQQALQVMQRTHEAVVGLRAWAVDGAQSAQTLGARREGSGVVIDAQGLVLTIGYLVLEAEQVELTTADGRRLPARVVAYDLATGLGLAQSLVPLGLAPAPLGRASALAEQDLLLFAHGGDSGAVGATRLVGRRAFAGSWEYHLEQALYTAPPLPMHSGAGLFNARGELVGIGSLAVADAGRINGVRQPGNLFVPVDLLPPVMDELRRQGHSSGSRRAWLGLNCVEDDDELVVVRVSRDSPAEHAGLQRGDRILRIDGQPVQALGTLWQALWRGGPPEREVMLQIRRGDELRELRVFSVDRLRTLKQPTGV